MKLFGRKGDAPLSGAKAEKAFRAGMSFFEGEDDSGSIAAAAERFEEAAAAGHVEAQFMLGHCNYRTVMSGRSYEKAVCWYSKAAEHGHAGAQYALGQMYENGHGVPQSMAEAASMYLRAAENGHAQAQLCYAELCESGAAGGDAEFWYSKAAEQGLKAAEEALERLKSQKKPGHRG